jgi:prepilin-type N-terminal cleavage/methylation domain-containing protein
MAEHAPGGPDLAGPALRGGRSAGFTLIELLIVVVILGILVSVVLLALGGTKDTALGSATATDKRILITAEDAFLIKHGTYADVAGLVSADLLHEASKYWTVVVGPGGSSYTLVPISTSGSGGGPSSPTCLTGESLSPAAAARQSTGQPGALANDVTINATTNSGCTSAVSAQFTPSGSGSQTVTLTGSGTTWQYTIGAAQYNWAPGTYPVNISAGGEVGVVTLTVCSASKPTCP